jgi:transcription-repair coupling factor (superfamily II helicase)
MPFWSYKKVRRKVRVAPQGADTLQNVARIKVKDLIIHDNFGAGKCRAAGKLCVDYLVELCRGAIG